MTIDDIGTELGVTLPDEYRRILLDYPASLRGTTAEGYEFLRLPDYIVSENKAVRRGTVFGMKWPGNHLIIGSDGGGNAYTINLEELPTKVYVFDHDDRSFRIIAQSIAEWVIATAEFLKEKREPTTLSTRRR